MVGESFYSTILIQTNFWDFLEEQERLVIFME